MKFSTLIALFAVSAISEATAIRLGEHARAKATSKVDAEVKDGPQSTIVENDISAAYGLVAQIDTNM